MRRSGRRGGLGKAQAHRRPAAWYRINPQWEVHAYVEYEKLLGAQPAGHARRHASDR
ncbi:hypothetical protein GTH44_03985 [Bradyrhizobium japonicum]|nr:hypothetical protein [Bradyrhizobium japonicum]